MIKFNRIIKKSRAGFTDYDCDVLAGLMAANDDNGVMDSVPVGAVFWLQFDPTHNALNSAKIDGEWFNAYTPVCDLQGSYAEGGGWLYTGDKFSLHSSGGLPRFDLGSGVGREVMADFRGNENSFLRRMHLFTCQIHNELVDMGYDFAKAKSATVAITNRITLEMTHSLTQARDTKAAHRLMDRGFANSVEWNFAAARYAHAMCPALVQGEDPLITGRLALDVDMRALFDGSEMAKTLDPSVSIAMRDMKSVPIKKNIIKRTLSRTVELGLPSYGELAVFSGIRDHGLTNTEYDAPIWAGMLMEAQRTHAGQTLGLVGATLVWAGNYGALLGNMDAREGLWYDLDDALPSTMLEAIDWLEA